ncbi:hypothetical protein [Streptomyces sp. CO7]
MPMIVDTSAPPVVPPERVTSPEGWLAARVDDVWAGVSLSYNGATPPSARNLAYNPGVEVDLTNTLTYAGATRERITTDSRFGSACMQITSTAATSGSQYLCEAIPAGTVIRVSAYVKVPPGGTTAFFAFRDASTTHNVVTAGTPAVGQWSRMTVSYTVPPGKVVDRIAVAFTSPVGTVWKADGMMVETGVSAPSEYIDGSQPHGVWEGNPNASPSVRVTALPNVEQVLKVRITRQDPSASAPVTVRSGDPAWAVEGVGAAYDHEAPLGVAVTYTATPVYADGTPGQPTSLAITVPAPGKPADVWIKSIDNPALSARVMVTSWPSLRWESRIEQVAMDGSPFPVVSQDVYTAAASEIEIYAEGAQVAVLEELLTTPGVRMIQTDPANQRRDQYVLFANPAQVMPATPTGPRLYTASLVQVARPDTADQPMRLPSWSWDEVPAQFTTWDEVAASYSSWVSLSTNGVS